MVLNQPGGLRGFLLGTFLTLSEMAYTIEHSSPAMHAESQIFTIPVTYTDRWWERIHPKTTSEEQGSSGDICFYLPPSSNAMLDLDSVTLELELAIKVKTKDTNWTFMGTQDLAAPVSNISITKFTYKYRNQ